MQHVGCDELRPQLGKERRQALGRFGGEPGQPAGGDRRPADLAQKLRRPGDRYVLAHHQVDGHRPHDWPVALPALLPRRGTGLSSSPHSGSAGPGAVLGHFQVPIGQVEHLAHFNAGHLGRSQALPATGAAHRRVHNCAVGAVDLCQRRPGRAGLLARTAPYSLFKNFLAFSRARRRRSARESRSSACFARSATVSDEGGLPELEELRPISRLSFSSSASRPPISPSGPQLFARSAAFSA